MGNDLKTSVVVDLKGNLVARSKRYSQSMRRFSRSGSRDMKHLRRNVDKTGKSMSKLGRRMFGLAAGYAAARKAMEVVELDARLTQLQVDARASAEQIVAVKKELFAVANKRGIRVDVGNLLSGFEEIISRTGDLKFAIENIENLGIAIRATKSAGSDVGAIFSNLFKGGVRDAKEVLAVMDALVQQTQEGSVPFRLLAKVGNKLFAPYIASGRTGAAAFLDMGAIAQIVIDAVGGEDEATEATKGLLSFLNKKDVQKKLRRAGIDVMDNGKMRSLPTLIREIYKATKGDAGILGQLFGETGVKVFQGFALKDNPAKLVRLAQLRASGETLTQNAMINAATAKAAIQSIKTRISRGANENISGPTKFMADFFDAYSTGDFSEFNKKHPRSKKSFFESFRDSHNRAWAASKAAPKPWDKSPAPAPEAKMTINLKAEPGTKATVNGLRARGMEVEVNSGNERMSGQ